MDIVRCLVQLLPVVLFSFLAFWKLNPVLFMIAAGASLMSGLYWYDYFTTELGLSIGLMLIAYAFICVSFAYGTIFWRDRLREE